jgi:hypothetical protein
MNKENGTLPPEAFRARIAQYALLTTLTWLALFAGMAFLRFGTG